MQASIIPFRPLQAQDHHSSDEFVTARPAFQADHVNSVAANQFQDGWMISYVDILTLLLTLFVILLAMSHFSDQDSAIPKDQAEYGLAQTETTEKVATAVEIKPEEILINSIQLALKKPQPVTEKKTQNHELAADPMMIAANTDIPVSESLANRNHHPLTLPVSVPDMLAAILPAHLSAPVMTAHIESEQVAGPLQLAETVPTTPVGNTIDSVTAVHTDQIEPNKTTEVKPLTTVAVTNQDQIINKLKQAGSATNLEIQQTSGDVNITISDDMLFPSGSESLTPDGIKSLSGLARIINDSGLQVSVEGHTDNTPISNQQFKSNWELSSARATTVTRLLIEQQVDPANIRAIGYADTRPRADNTTEAGRNRNRRVTIILHMPRNESSELTTEM